MMSDRRFIAAAILALVRYRTFCILLLRQTRRHAQRISQDKFDLSIQDTLAKETRNNSA